MAVLFALGIVCIVTRRNMIYVLMGIEMVLNSANINFIAFNRFNGDADHGPNPCLGPIATSPFVAVEVWPAELGCSAGLATTADAQVIDRSDTPIEGLYACGNDMGSIMAGSYPGPGTTLGPALVFGYRAAMHAARARTG